jgi:PAS domain S-box-containing protein
MKAVKRQGAVKQGRDLEKEIEELKIRLGDAEQTLQAIRSGEVDALVVSTKEGDRVFTLRGAETPYRMIVENISEGAATLTPEGVILYANAHFSNMLGIPLERMIGTLIHDFVWEPDRVLLPSLLEKALRQIARKEINLVMSDNEFLPAYLSLRSIPIDDEKRGLSMIITDMSDRKRAEEDLRRAHDELDARVHQRTKELTEANRFLQREIAVRHRAEEDLKRAVEDLERSNKELEQFAYVASHDLQEPLRTVASYVELLALKYKGQFDEKADKYIYYAVDGANRMSALINDLLAYSRVGTRGKTFEPVQMSAVLEQATGNLKSAIKEIHAVITSDQLPTVTGDFSQLVQLLQNLIGNGLKFRKRDVPPAIHISVERRNNEAIFGVRDNGIGIEARFYERIFTIFQRLHTREEYPGTGVGLAICRRIVERHDGRMWLDSKPGEGSTFYFSLPITAEDQV